LDPLEFQQQGNGFAMLALMLQQKMPESFLLL
jgi:hypothetical protein